MSRGFRLLTGCGRLPRSQWSPCTRPMLPVSRDNRASAPTPARLEIGVAVFFVISGFLLYRPFVVAHLSGRDAPETLKFWVRRLFRIVPAYWLALTVIVYVLHGSVFPSGVGQVLIHYSFLQIYFPTALFSGIGPAWSLCTEMSFYLFLPLYAAGLAFRRRTASVQLKWELLGLMAMAAVSFVFRAWALTRHGHCGGNCLTHPAFPTTMSDWLPSCLDLFAIGMFLAVMSAWFVAHDSEPAWLRHRFMPLVSWGLAIVVFFWVSHLGIDPQPLYSASPATNILKQTLYGLFAFLLVAPAVFGPQGGGRGSTPPSTGAGCVDRRCVIRHLSLARSSDPGVLQRYRCHTFRRALLDLVRRGPARRNRRRIDQLSRDGATAPRIRKPGHSEEVCRRSGPSEPIPVASSPAEPRTFWDILTTALQQGARRLGAWRDSFGVHWFLPALAVIVVIAVAIRIWFTVEWTFGRDLAGDAMFFHQSAAALTSGKGYSAPGLGAPHALMPTAQHPPFFPMVLATFDLLGFHSIDAQRVLLGVLGSLGVFLTGLLGYRVSGPVVGLVAAGIAAAHPLWFQTSAALMSESIYLVVIPAVLLLALGCLDHTTRWRFVVLGGAIGLATLTRSDALDLAIFLGVPVVLAATRSGRQRLALGRCIFAGLLIVLGPWMLRNEVQLRGVTLSDDQGVTLAGSYCSDTMRPDGIYYGGFSSLCADGSAGFFVKEVPPPDGAHSWTELTMNKALWSSSVQYAQNHLGQLPGTVLARVENTWGVARTNQQVYQAAFEGRIPSFERSGLELARVLLLFELIGCVVLARRSMARS